jgi:decaprenylphospho-beta-D-ribofuranose 2-oxidase
MTRLSGWGRTPVAEGRVRTARSEADVAEAMAEGPLIARGNGRSYGDPAMSPGLTLRMTGMDRMLSFDAATGTLVAEAGVLLSDIVATFLQRGWFLLVTPGTKFVTLGGAIAADVHGKNHHGAGSFRACVDWVDVMDAAGAVRRVDQRSDPDGFDQISGAMGLTGVMLRAAIRLQPVETGWIRQETIAAESVDAAIDAFEENMDVPYSVAWIDCIGHPPRLGRSIVMLGRHATRAELPRKRRGAPFDVPGRLPLGVPFDLPRFVLRAANLRVFNALYFALGRRNAGISLIDWDRYFYPLDAISDWNRIYGRAGFYQFQCALPLEGVRPALREMLRSISEADTGSFLSVLKRFGKGAGALSFPFEGYTLALDFPADDRSRALIDRLDAITLEHGGRFYLAKDARLSPATFHAADPRFAALRALRRETGIAERFTSLQSERLEL